MSIRIRKILSGVILLFLVGWAVFYVASHFSEFRGLFDLSLGVVGVIFVLLLVDSVVLGLFNKVLMEDFDITLTFREWYGLSIASNLWNYILPFQGGAGVRAIYLKRVYDFTISKFLVTMFALYFVSFLVNSALGLSCFLYLYLTQQYLNVMVLGFLMTVFIGVSSVILFSPRVPEFRNRVLSKISELVNSWYVVRRNRTLVTRLTLIILVHAAVELLVVYFSFYAYGVTLGFIQCLLISALLSFSVLIKITPGSLGITEAIVVVGGQIFNVSPVHSLLAAGLMRVVNLILIFGLGPIFHYLLSLDVHTKTVAEKEMELERAYGTNR